MTDMTLPAALVAKLAKVAVPTLSGVLYGKGLRSRFLHGLVPCNPDAAKMIGPAFTIRAIPVREDIRDATLAGRAPNMHRKAFSAAEAGAVIVVASGGAATGVSVIGDIIATALKRDGIAGVVLDTGVSDLPVISRMELPVHCAGGSAPVPGGALVMIVDYDLPVGIAGVAVFPGDVMVGDASGTVCIPREMAEEVADAAIEKERMEEWILEQIAAGAPLEGTYPPNAETKARFKAERG